MSLNRVNTTLSFHTFFSVCLMLCTSGDLNSRTRFCFWHLVCREKHSVKLLKKRVFLYPDAVLLHLMKSAASERKSNEFFFWRTCSPSPSYMLIRRGCHKLHKINSIQSVGPSWKHDSISNTTFLIMTKTEERTEVVTFKSPDGFFFIFMYVNCEQKYIFYSYCEKF